MNSGREINEKVANEAMKLDAQVVKIMQAIKSGRYKSKADETALIAFLTESVYQAQNSWDKGCDAGLAIEKSEQFKSLVFGGK